VDWESKAGGWGGAIRESWPMGSRSERSCTKRSDHENTADPLPPEFERPAGH